MHAPNLNNILQEGLGIMGDHMTVGEGQLQSSFKYFMSSWASIALFCCHDVVHDIVCEWKYNVKKYGHQEIQGALTHQLRLVKENSSYGILTGKKLVSKNSIDQGQRTKRGEIDDIAVNSISNIGSIKAHTNGQINLASTEHILKIFRVDNISNTTIPPGPDGDHLHEYTRVSYAQAALFCLHEEVCEILGDLANIVRDDKLCVVLVRNLGKIYYQTSINLTCFRENGGLMADDS